MSAKSDVGERLLDPDGVIGADIIRLGDELGQLKRSQEVCKPFSFQSREESGLSYTVKPDVKSILFYTSKENLDLFIQFFFSSMPSKL